MINVPMSKVPPMIRGFVPWVGFLLLILILLGLAAKRKNLSSTHVFLCSYIGVLFLWPFHDARFWLPVVPLLTAYSVLSLRNIVWSKFPKAFLLIYCSLFVLAGVISLGYSTRISFAGSRFPDRYGDGSLRSTYCVAFQSCGNSIDTSKVQPKILHLLRVYQ